MFDLSDASATALVCNISVLILKNNSRYFIDSLVALLSNVLDALINSMLRSQETPSSDLLLQRIHQVPLAAAGRIRALSCRSGATACLASEWFANHLVLISGYSLLSHIVLARCWRIILLRTSRTRFLDSSRIFLDSFTRELFGLV